MKHRGLLASMVLVALVFGTVAVGSAIWLRPLPHPAVASHEQLKYWLVLEDLREHPTETSVALVDRIQSEFASQLGTETSTELSQQYRTRLIENADYLKSIWFATRCQQYQEIVRRQRFDFMQRQIDFVFVWSQLDWDLKKIENDDQLRFQSTLVFFDDVERWLDDSEPSVQHVMRHAVRDGVFCWLATYDLTDEPMTTRLELAKRISADLERGADLDEMSFDLNDKQAAQLQLNTELLLQDWVYQVAMEYSKLDTAGKTQFLNKELDRVILLSNSALVNKSLVAKQAKNNSSALLTKIDGWVKNAPEDQRPQVNKLVEDAKLLMFMKVMSGLGKSK